MTLSFLIYRSETLLRPGGLPARHLLYTARRRNALLGLTGCLHHEEGLFCQWLEGPLIPLQSVRRAIDADRRHTSIVHIASGPLPVREFERWQMRYCTVGKCSVLQWMADHAWNLREPMAVAQNLLKFLKDAVPAH